MSETDTAPEAEAASDTHRDERLSPEFVESIVTLLEDDHVDGVVGLELVDDLGDPALQGSAQGVALVGPVQRGDRDAVGHLDQDEIVSHPDQPSPRSSGGRKSKVVRSPTRTSTDEIHPPMAEKWSSRIEPSFRVASSKS